MNYSEVSATSTYRPVNTITDMATTYTEHKPSYSKKFSEEASKLASNNDERLLDYLKSHKNKIDASHKDENGNNLIHNIVGGSIQNKDKILNELFKTDNVNSAINMYNNIKDTPLHMAVKTEQHDIADLLINNGANKYIQNGAGFSVETDVEPVADHIFDINNKSSVFAKKNTDSEISNNVSNLFKNVKGSDTKPNSSHKKNAHGGEDNNSISSTTNKFIDNLFDMGSAKYGNRYEASGGVSKKRTKKGTNGKKKGTKKAKKGTKKAKKGTKKTKPISRQNSRSNSRSNSRPRSRSSSRNRENNKVNDLHIRTVQKIMDLLNISKEEAGYYKAEIYRRVREKNDKLTGYERALEMEKMATKEILDQITPDIPKIKEAIEKKRAEYSKTETPKESSIKAVSKIDTPKKSEVSEAKAKKSEVSEAKAKKSEVSEAKAKKSEVSEAKKAKKSEVSEAKKSETKAKKSEVSETSSRKTIKV